MKMTSNQVQDLYKNVKIEGFRLRNSQDLFNVHGFDFTKVKGFDTLSSKHQALFEQFLFTFFNGWGLEARATLKPKSVYYVEEREYQAEDESTIKTVFNIVDAEGNVIAELKKHTFSRKKTKVIYAKHFLRFDYEIYDRKSGEWLHIISPGEYY